MDPFGLRGRRRKKRGQEFSFLVVCRLFCFVWPFFLLLSLLLINLDNISNYTACVFISNYLPLWFSWCFILFFGKNVESKGSLKRHEVTTNLRRMWP